MDNSGRCCGSGRTCYGAGRMRMALGTGVGFGLRIGLQQVRRENGSSSTLEVYMCCCSFLRVGWRVRCIRSGRDHPLLWTHRRLNADTRSKSGHSFHSKWVDSSNKIRIRSTPNTALTPLWVNAAFSLSRSLPLNPRPVGSPALYVTKYFNTQTPSVIHFSSTWSTTPCIAMYASGRSVQTTMRVQGGCRQVRRRVA